MPRLFRGAFLWARRMAQESRLSIVIEPKSAEQHAADLARVLTELEKAGVRVTQTSTRAGREVSSAGSKMAQAGKEARSGASSVDGFGKSMNDARSAAISLRGALTGAFVGVSIAGTISKIIQETVNLEEEQAQLAVVLRSTGDAAGFSRVQLNEMAASMSHASTLIGGEITRSEPTGNRLARRLHPDVGGRSPIAWRGVPAHAEPLGRRPVSLRIAPNGCRAARWLGGCRSISAADLAPVCVIQALQPH